MNPARRARTWYRTRKTLSVFRTSAAKGAEKCEGSGVSEEEEVLMMRVAGAACNIHKSWIFRAAGVSEHTQGRLMKCILTTPSNFY